MTRFDSNLAALLDDAIDEVEAIERQKRESLIASIDDALADIGTDLPPLPPPVAEQIAQDPAPSRLKDFGQRVVQGLLGFASGQAEGVAMVTEQLRNSDLPELIADWFTDAPGLTPEERAQAINQDELDPDVESLLAYKVGTEIGAFTQRHFPGDPRLSETLLSRVGQGIGNALGFGIEAALLGPAGRAVQLGATAVSGGLLESASIFERARAGGIPDGQAISTALKYGMVSGGTEVVPVGAALRVFSGQGGKLVGRAIDRLVSRIDRASGGTIPKLITTAAGIGGVGVAEAAQEALQTEIGNRALRQMGANDPRLQESLAQAATVGGIVGSFFGAIAAGLGRVMRSPGAETLEARGFIPTEETAGQPASEAEVPIEAPQETQIPRTGAAVAPEAAGEAAAPAGAAQSVPVLPATEQETPDATQEGMQPGDDRVQHSRDAGERPPPETGPGRGTQRSAAERVRRDEQRKQARQPKAGRKIRASEGSAYTGQRTGAAAAEGEFATYTQVGDQVVVQKYRVPLQPVPMFFITRLARQLMGKLPKIRKLPPGRLGQFDPKTQTITINWTTAQDETQLARTLAHEIGHLEDYIGDVETLDRGNVLGRIAKLKRFVGEFMALPGRDRLSDEEFDRLRKAAEAEAAKDFEQTVDLMITRTLGITPKDVLDIWNAAADVQVNKELEKFIAKLNTAQKKAIVAQALKGRVPDELKQFVKNVSAPTGVRLNIKGRPTKEYIRQVYERLIAEELRKRSIFEQDLRAELIRLSEWWRPYDRNRAPDSFVRYRESSEELYADAISVLLNSPEDLERQAPQFFEAFMAFTDRRPEFWQFYGEILQILVDGPESVAGEIRQTMRDSFLRGAERIKAKVNEARNARRSFGESIRLLYQNILDSTEPAKRAIGGKSVRVFEEFDEKAVAEATLDELFTTNSVLKQFADQIDGEVYQPLLEQGITHDDIGEFLFLRRVVKERFEDGGGRFEIANPWGMTPTQAGEQLESMRKRLGNERYDLLIDRMRHWNRAIVFPVMKRATEAGLFDQEAFKNRVVPNIDNYATFLVVKHIEATVPHGIIAQTGTFEEVANPFIATNIKMARIIRMTDLNRAKLVLRNTEKLPGVSFRRVALKPRERIPRKTPKPGHDFLYLLDNGKLEAYETDEAIAKAFRLHDIGGLMRYAQLMQSGIYRTFHPLFVTFSPGFVANNPMRDLRRTYLNVGSLAGALKRTRGGKSIGLARIVYTWLRNLRQANLVRKGQLERVEPMIREALEHRAVAGDFTDIFSATGEVAPTGITGDVRLPIEERLSKGRRTALRGIGHLLTGLRIAGQLQEISTKLTGFKVLRERAKLGPREAAYYVRKWAGTPDYQQRGLWTPITNSLWMYSKVRWNGLQADLALATSPATRFGWWWRMLVTSIMPTSLTKLALLGFFGPQLAELFKHIPSYFLDQYDVIPLGFVDDEEGEEKKALFLTLAKDDLGRLISRIWSNAIDVALEQAGYPSRRGLNEAITSVFGAAWDAVLPASNPVIDIGAKWTQYASGMNPYDSFYGEPVVPRTEWEAGGWYSTRKMLAWSANKFGVLSVLAHEPVAMLTGQAFEPGTESTTEIVYRSVPGLNRILRVSDRGLHEKEWADLEAEDQESARFKLGLPANVRRLNGERYRLNRRDAATLNAHDTVHRLVLNQWYQQDYLELTRKIKDAQDAGREEDVSALKAELQAETDRAMNWKNQGVDQPTFDRIVHNLSVKLREGETMESRARQVNALASELGVTRGQILAALRRNYRDTRFVQSNGKFTPLGAAWTRLSKYLNVDQ